MMENVQDSGTIELDGDQRRDICSTSTSFSSVDKLCGRQKPTGGVKAADLVWWKRCRVPCGVITVATVTWLLFERSGLPFLTICSDVFLVLIVLLFLRANYAVLRNKQLEELPELELSEEMVNYVASSLRVKINSMLMMAHDITLGKDFRLFFMVVVVLWILSTVGSLVSFVTLAYIGVIISVTTPALYSKFRGPLDRITGFMHSKFSEHYRIVDESIISRLPPGVPKEKDA